MCSSYISPEQRVPQDHPLRPLRAMTDEALQQLKPRFDKLYAKTGRPSIAPEKLLRALLLQALYSVRSERMLMEQLDYNLLFRWFVGLNMDDSVWDVTVFTKNREERLKWLLPSSGSLTGSVRSFLLCFPLSAWRRNLPCHREFLDRLVYHGGFVGVFVSCLDDSVAFAAGCLFHNRLLGLP